jgi:hypothetical protein
MFRASNHFNLSAVTGKGKVYPLIWHCTAYFSKAPGQRFWKPAQAALCPSVPFGQKATCLSIPPQHSNSYLMSNSSYPITWLEGNEQMAAALPPFQPCLHSLLRHSVGRIGVPTTSIYASGRGATHHLCFPQPLSLYPPTKADFVCQCPPRSGVPCRVGAAWLRCAAPRITQVVQKSTNWYRFVTHNAK